MKEFAKTSAYFWVFTSLLFGAFYPRTATADGPRIGNAAPPLELAKLLQAPPGFSVDWNDMRGRVVVLDFWATWCGPCVASLPHWNTLVDTFKGRPVHFIALTDENEELVTSFLKRKPIHSWIGIGALTRETYGIRGIPCTVIVNQQGIVVGVTHPALLEAKHITEVLETGKSSLPPPPERRDNTESGVEPVATSKPLFELSVRPSGPRPKGRGFNCWGVNAWNTEFTGEYATVESAILNLFQLRASLLDVRTKLSDQEYDFVLRAPEMSPAERDQLLFAMFRTTFGLQLRKDPVERTVYVLKVANTNAPGLRPSAPNARGGGGGQNGGLKLSKATVNWLPGYLDRYLKMPVFNETGLTNFYDIRLHWKMSKRELLLTAFDGAVLTAALSSKREKDSKLTDGQRRYVEAIRGKGPNADLHDFSPEDQENILLFREELAKPDEDRFMPDPEAVIAAVHEQMGLSLAKEKRMLQRIVVEKAEPQK